MPAVQMLLAALGARPLRVRRALIAAALAPLVLGAVAMVVAPRDKPWFTCTSLPHAPLDHLARCDRGARVRVSSMLLDYGHHPLYLIDGRVGGLIEKWASFDGDPLPTVEVAWDKPVLAHQIVLHHAGAREDNRFSNLDFDVKVKAADGWRLVSATRGNRLAVTSHEFPPTLISAARLEVITVGVDPKNIVARLFEFEVH